MYRNSDRYVRVVRVCHLNYAFWWFIAILSTEYLFHGIFTTQNEVNAVQLTTLLCELLNGEKE